MRVVSSKNQTTTNPNPFVIEVFFSEAHFSQTIAGLRSGPPRSDFVRSYPVAAHEPAAQSRLLLLEDAMGAVAGHARELESK